MSRRRLFLWAGTFLGFGVILFLLGGAMFWPAEAFGPPTFIFAVLATWIWIGVAGADARTAEPTIT